MRLHHCPSYVMERWKGRWRKRVSRKSLIFFLKLAQRKGKYFHHPNVNLSNPKIAFFLCKPWSAQSVVILSRTSLSGWWNPRSADYGEFRQVTKVRSHPWQISCFPFSSHQLIPHELNWRFPHRGHNLSCLGWPSLPPSFVSLFATQRTGIAIDASLLFPGINAVEWIFIIVLYGTVCNK